VANPPGDISELDFALGDGAELLVIDSYQRRTGFDPNMNQTIEQIPASVYFRDSLQNDVTGAPPSRTTHLVEISQPSQGTYQLVVTGLKFGTYLLSTRTFSQDGSAQSDITTFGISGPGSSSTFVLKFSPTAGAASTLQRAATFQSTLADINNSLQFGLIDNKGIANSLSQKLQAAEDVTNPARGNILDAFEHEVNAQAGKHIMGTAAQVLLQDADSLRGQ
jgi:hypothetical protein